MQKSTATYRAQSLCRLLLGYFFPNSVKEREKKDGLKIKLKSSKLILELAYIYRFKDIEIKMQ